MVVAKAAFMWPGVFFYELHYRHPDGRMEFVHVMSSVDANVQGVKL